MSSETPPSIPPRKKSGSEKTGSTPAVTKPAAGATGPARPATGTTARPSSGPPASASSSGAAAAPSGRSGSGTATATATQEATRPAAAPAPAASGSAAGASAPRTPTADTTATARPAAKTATPATTAAAPATSGGARRVRLAVSRIDPWSVMKLSFLISVAVGIMLVVATAVVWLTLDGLHVFSSINDLVTEVLADSTIDLMQYVEFKRVISVATLIGVVDVFLITALSTIGAFLYNITAALVGGVHVTMTDE